MSEEAFSHFVRTDRIPAAGKHIRVETGEDERRRIAEALGIAEVARLTVEVELRPLGSGAVSVRGMVSAFVVQTDVVTLEPVGQELAEPVDVTLTPAEGLAEGREAFAAGSREVEERDLYRNGRIDLGAIALEHLALALDPYPRAPGVEFAGHVEDDSPVAGSPFAALAGLKRDPS